MALNKTFRFRNQWLGIAMVWIMWYHSGFSGNIRVFHYLKSIGYGGVDICLFASGIGCYFSLEKDSDILRFLKRRIKRLAPVYLCFIIPWLCFRMATTGLSWNAVLGNLLGIQSLVSWENHFNWYIGGLIVFYLSMPYLKGLTDSCEKITGDLLVWVGMIMIGLPFWNADGNDIVILSRLPVLYAGVVCAKMAKQGYVLKKTDYTILLTAAAAGTAALFAFFHYMSDHLWSCGLYWYPFTLIAPGICVVWALLMDTFQKYKLAQGIGRILEIIGVFSFEVYLIHVFLYERIMPSVLALNWELSNNLLWVLTLPIVAVGSLLLNKLAAGCSGLLKKQNNKTKA